MIEQNYFQFDQQYNKQTDGLSMGPPNICNTDGYMNPTLEHKQIYIVLVKHQII